MDVGSIYLVFGLYLKLIDYLQRMVAALARIYKSVTMVFVTKRDTGDKNGWSNLKRCGLD